jgi:hypothetical protein
VALRVEKLDVQTGRFSLVISLNGHSITKSDRHAAEPLQFFAGADRMLYQVVVYEIVPGRVSGYLSVAGAANVLHNNNTP